MLRIGTGIANITPNHPVELFGFYQEGRVFTGVHTELYARAIVLDDDNERVALVSCDLCEISRELVERTKLLIKDEAGIENVVIAMTHTHSAPAVCFGRGLGKIDKDYYDSVPGLITEAVLKALVDLNPVDGLSRGRVVAKDASYNRSVEGGYVDDELSALIFNNDVVLWSFACHPVSQKRKRVPREDGSYNEASTLISGDFPAVVARLLASTSPYIRQSLFFQGADGDLDPKGYFNQKGNTEAMASGLVRDIAWLWILAQTVPLRRHHLWFKQVTMRLDLKVPTVEDIKTLAAERKSQKHRSWAKFWAEWEESMLAKLSASEPPLPYIEAEVTALAVGDCVMLFHPAELYASLGKVIKDASPFPQTWVVSNANGTVGYLPDGNSADTRKAYSDVQAPAACDMFPYQEGQGQKLVDALIELAEEAGRAMGIKKD
jgi:hypothetical protein